MTHPIYRVRSFEIVAPYTLRIRFDDDTDQTIDFQPVLAGELYEPLCQQDLFNKVKIDHEVHTLVWPNGADIAPETLHKIALALSKAPVVTGIEELLEGRPPDETHAERFGTTIVSEATRS